MKEVKRLVRDKEYYFYNIQNSLKTLSDESLKREERKFRNLIEHPTASSIFIADDEKDFLSCIYNNIVMEGGDRQLWEVIGFDYDEEDTDIFHCIDTIRNGDIDSTDLRVLYRLISTTDGAFKAKMKETIVTRLNQISDKDCKENK